MRKFLVVGRSVSCVGKEGWSMLSFRINIFSFVRRRVFLENFLEGLFRSKG